MKRRYNYILHTKTPHCICVLTSEIERVKAALGPDAVGAYNHIHSNVLIDLAALESAETAVERQDMRENKRNYLRSVVREYGRDKATVHALGFLPA